MGAGEQPYLYPSSPYSDFNPRAATQASYRAHSGHNRARPKQDGPLLQFDRPESGGDTFINVSGNNASYTSKAFDEVQARKRTAVNNSGPVVSYNHHPDSWTTIVAGHSVSYNPMPANTKTKVNAIRWTQLALRLIGGVGATGLLACMITLRNMQNVFSWIMRIAPAWDMIVTLYAIYHLCRPATARTPGSTASYHMFATIMDLALLPFYVYLAVYARRNYVDPPEDFLRWTSLFDNSNATTNVIFATWTGAMAVAGLHLLSTMLDVWLIVLFKKISELPPDVNPLEDNLTSRASRTSKHKYKNSEVALSGDSWSEKKPGFYSGSMIASSDDIPLPSTRSRDVDETDFRKIPFNHSRIKSKNAFSPHNPRTALLAQQHFEEVQLYEQPESARNSRAGLDSPSRIFDTELTRHARSPRPNELVPMPPPLRDRSSRPNSSQNVHREMDVEDVSRIGSPAVPNAAPLQAMLKSQQNENLLGDNWYALDDDNSTVASTTASRPQSSHKPLERFESFEPQPLKMNPPTPPPKEADFPEPEDDAPGLPVIKRKPLAARNDNGNGQGEHKLTFQIHEASDDESAWDANVRGGTPKRKYYGDLAAATRGVLGAARSKAAAGASRILSTETTKSTGTIDAAAMDSTGMSALTSYGYGRVPSRKHDKKERKGRVVSRTGVDIVETIDEESSRVGGYGLRGRREVSGKVVEEGRGGGWWPKKLY